MAQATFSHGKQTMIDYTPSAAVSAGDVILAGNTTGLTCVVAHLDIANAALGAVGGGDGVYDCVSLQNNANYAKVWWDDTNNKLTSTSTNNALFGFIVSGGGAGANTTVQAMHRPYV